MNLDLFATRLKTLRSSRSLTLQQIGDAVGYSLKTIGNLENARQPPSLNMVLLLADCFDVSIDYLVGRKDSDNACRNIVSDKHNIFHNKNKEFKNSSEPDGRAVNLDVFAQRLRTLRLARRLTLRNVGDAAGCHMTTIGNLEKTHKAPSLGVMLALANFFNVSVDYLVGRTDYKTDANDHGDKTPDPRPSPSEERKKLIELVENLPEEKIDKALSYITFLGYDQQREDKKT